ncbi:MAG TPA: S8 family serine peptidase [Gemmatimonadota bacterium]|nr:S8 family serine peptidase [Gemmatimonadota bacterium]
MKRANARGNQRPLFGRLRGAALAIVPATLLAVGPPPDAGWSRAGSGVASPAPVRVIIQLADAASRERLLRESVTLPLPLDARHERVIRGLKAIHSASLSEARHVLDAARQAGALTEMDRLWSVNAIVALVDPEWISRLEADPAVARVVVDRRLTLAAAPTPTPADAIAGGAATSGRAREALVPTPELEQIGVPAVWADGITGKGTIVANVDSGVNGDDETMDDSWRGLFAGSDATWYAPVSLTVFPVDDETPVGHGTPVMGIMAGGVEEFGVAFDATWIAGDLFEEREGWVSTAIKIFEWLTDPDGDPSTTTDVPDVVNNSWGINTNRDDQGRLRCDPIFNEAIDALEAGGTIVINSAGNEGDAGVTAPAQRATTAVNAFAVGAVDEELEPLRDFGGQLITGAGPSPCGGAFATKPEVVAPGDRVTSRSRFNATLSNFVGTSFSTPMVSGVVALMRSKDPTITPEEAKTILIETAVDLGASGDDNTLGHGLVDAEAALARVERPTQPLARLVGYRPAAAVPAGKLGPAAIEDALVLRPGQAADLVPLLSNHGPALPATIGVLSSSTPGVTVTRSTLPLAAASTGEFFGPAAGESFGVDVGSTVPPGSDISLSLTVQGASVGPFRMLIKAGDPVEGTFATHDAGRVRLSVTNFGGLGYYTGIHGSDFVLRGEGFRFPPTSPNWLFHGGLLAGTGPTRLSDDIPYGEDTEASTDWIPLFGAPIEVGEAAGGQVIEAAYDDRRALSPLGLEVIQRSFAFDEAGEDAFVLLQYVIRNTSSQSLTGLRLGLFADWDLPGSGGDPQETAGWDPTRRLGFVEGEVADQPSLGVVWLDDVALGQVTYAVLRREDVIDSPVGNPTSPGNRAPAVAQAPDIGEFSDTEKWNALASGQTNTSESNPQDLYQIIGVGPLALAAGAIDTVAVALVAGENQAGLQANAEAAREAYFLRVLGIEPPPPPPPPTELALEQNFPNPFRLGEQTTIRFAVPEPASGPPRASLAVFDVLGRRVRTLVDGDVIAGEQAVTWDGASDAGATVPSGVYLARLESGGSEKMVRILFVR